MQLTIVFINDNTSVIEVLENPSDTPFLQTIYLRSMILLKLKGGRLRRKRDDTLSFPPTHSYRKPITVHCHSCTQTLKKTNSFNTIQKNLPSQKTESLVPRQLIKARLILQGNNIKTC